MLTRFRKKRRSGGFPLDMLILLPVLIYCAHCAESPGPQPDDFSGSLDEAPHIEGLTNYAGPVLSPTTVLGSNFSASATENTVYFAGVEAEVTGVTKGSDGEPDRIDTIVPAALPLGPAQVTVVVNGQLSNSVTFQVVAARTITGLNRPEKILTADLDADGDLDFLVFCTEPIDGAMHPYIAVILNDGAGSFEIYDRYPIEPYSDQRGLSIGDVNNDGVLDMVVGFLTWRDEETSHVRLWLGNGDGSFGEGVDLISWEHNYKVSSVATADVDNDGNLDVLVQSWEMHDGAILRGNGDGTFREPLQFPEGDSFYVPPLNSLSIADMDGDGYLDLPVRTPAIAGMESEVWGAGMLLGNGDATFTDKVVSGVPVSGKTFAVADFNGDGHADLCVAGLWSNESPRPLTILLNDGVGGLDVAGEYQIVDFIPTALTVQDLNGDSFPDMAFSTRSDFGHFFRDMAGGLAVFLNDGNGFFAPPDLYRVPMDAHDLVAGDFNMDGITDIATVVHDADIVWIMPGTGGGDFQSSRHFSTEPVPGSLSTGDFNSDGVPDLVTAHYGVAYIGLSDSGFSPGVSLLYGKREGLLSAPEYIPFGVNLWHVAVGDLDSDSTDDLVVTDLGWSAAVPDIPSEGSDGGLYALFGSHSDGVQGHPVRISDHSTRAVAIGDLNLDKVPDIAATSAYTNEIYILLGRGDGSFLQEVPFNTGPLPIGVSIADFNTDGLQDLVVANASQQNVTVHLGRGDGSFGTAKAYSAGRGWGDQDLSHGTPLYPSAPPLATDLDGDGVLDIAVTSFDTCSLGFLMGNGDGTFRHQPSGHENICGSKLLAEDLDADGHLDLAIACGDEGSVALLLGNAAGGFGLPAYYGVGNASDLTVVDIDQDGDLDICATDFMNSSVSVMLLEPGGVPGGD